MNTDQPDQNTTIQPGADQPQTEAAPDSGREGKVIPFPAPIGGGMELAPEVLEGELLTEQEYARRPMPVVLPLWLRSRETARATARWAVEYAGRHVAFHAWRAPPTDWHCPGGPCAAPHAPSPPDSAG